MARAEVRVGAVDIGTNTVRLAIADVDSGRLAVVDRRSRVAGLGTDVDRRKRLDEAAMTRAMIILESYGALLRGRRVEVVRAVATSALRDAANRDRLLDRAGLALGVRPEVISAEDEAALSFRGATAGFDGAAPYLVIDPGGGSTELVMGRAEPEYSVSVDIGSIRLTERKLPDRPAPAADLEAARTEVARLFAVVRLPAAPGSAIGVGGTFTALAAIARDLTTDDVGAVHGATLTLAQVDRVVGRLAAMAVAETAAIPSLDPARAPVLLAGAVVAGGALRAAGAAEVVVSACDILDGIALGLGEA